MAVKKQTRDVLDLFHPLTAAWFRAIFDAHRASAAGLAGHRARRKSTLILAPTGTGKTLTAFLWCLDRLMFDRAATETAAAAASLLSPLKALAVDVERNLRSPLGGIARMAPAGGEPLSPCRRSHPHRRHAQRRARPFRPASRRHPHHHPGVALPAAHLGRRRRLRSRRHRDRRRDSRRRAHQAWRAPGALASSGWRRSMRDAGCSASASPPPSAHWRKWLDFLGGAVRRTELNTADEGAPLAKRHAEDLSAAIADRTGNADRATPAIAP